MSEDILKPIAEELGLKLDPAHRDKWSRIILRAINNRVDAAIKQTTIYRLWQFEGDDYIFSKETFEVLSFGNENSSGDFSFKLGDKHMNIVNPKFTVLTSYDPLNFYVSGFLWHGKKWHMVRLRFVGETYAAKVKAEKAYTVKMRSWEKMI